MKARHKLFSKIHSVTSPLPTTVSPFLPTLARRTPRSIRGCRKRFTPPTLRSPNSSAATMREWGALVPKSRLARDQAAGKETVPLFANETHLGRTARASMNTDIHLPLPAGEWDEMRIDVEARGLIGNGAPTRPPAPIDAVAVSCFSGCFFTPLISLSPLPSTVSAKHCKIVRATPDLTSKDFQVGRIPARPGPLGKKWAGSPGDS